MSTAKGQELYARVGYDARKELRALELLERDDPAGCRAALTELVADLRLEGLDGDATTVAQLLADLLQRVNRALHRGRAQGIGCQTNRLAIIERVAGSASAHRARHQFLALVDRWLSGPAAEPIHHPRVADAIRLLDTEYRSRVSLSSVAQQLAVSPSYLARLFRRETGVTLTCYLQRVRLRHATALLAAETHSCAEIAYEVGYQNYRDFYRNLLKYRGISPRRLRRQLRERSAAAGPARIS